MWGKSTEVLFFPNKRRSASFWPSPNSFQGYNGYFKRPKPLFVLVRDESQEQKDTQKLSVERSDKDVLWGCDGSHFATLRKGQGNCRCIDVKPWYCGASTQRLLIKCDPYIFICCLGTAGWVILSCHWRVEVCSKGQEGYQECVTDLHGLLVGRRKRS